LKIQSIIYPLRARVYFKCSILAISLLVFSNFTYGQNKVNFEVRDGSENPLFGANIIVKGTTTGATTDANGFAQLYNLPDGKVVIEVSFIGYEEEQIQLNFPEDNEKAISIILEEGEELEEIIIEATRSSRTIDDIPTRIETITGEELGEKAAMNSSNIGMLLRETTGVQMQQTSLSSGNLSIRIQGLDGRYTQILKDGFPLYGGFAGGLSIMQIPPLDLRQVELIKGSNSTLYGGGAIAGLVNLVSITPVDEPELNIMLNQTSAVGTTGNIFYAQKYGKTGFSVYGSAYLQTPFDPDDDGFSNIPKAKTFSLNPTFYYYFNPKSTLMVGLNTVVDDRIGGDMEVITGNEDETHVFSEENNSDRITSRVSYQYRDEGKSVTVKNSINYFSRKLTIPDYRFWGNQLSSFSEVLYTLDGNEQSDWQFGLNHYFEQFTEDDIDNFPQRDYSYNTIGVFAQNTTDFTDHITFEGGLRTDYDFDFGPFFLPRVALLYKANQKFSTRLGGAMGYKLPTIFTEDAEKRYFRNIVPINANDVDPETSIGGNFDINYRTALPHDMTFSINQMFFLTRLKNALVLREDGFSNYFENADGNVLSSGFETNIKLTYHDFKFFANYAFINTDLQYDNINKQKPLTPKHSAGFVLMYETEEKWSVGYELYYTSSQFDELYDEKPDYWIMGFMVMRHIKNLSLFINFENFTNTIESDFEPLVLPPVSNPTFPDIWAPSDGFIFNGGFKLDIF
jgi:iron complex outermembrane receptor protein